MKRTVWNDIKSSILKMRDGASDETALDCIAIYPEWSGETIYEVGDRVRDGDGLYKRRQPQNAPEIYRPSETPALWERITVEEGTISNPIRYESGMELIEGKYYTQLDVLYLCTRTSGAPVYHTLAALVDIYVEVVTV